MDLYCIRHLIVLLPESALSYYGAGLIRSLLRGKGGR